jgi:hypothetical protein
VLRPGGGRGSWGGGGDAKIVPNSRLICASCCGVFGYQNKKSTVEKYYG